MKIIRIAAEGVGALTSHKLRTFFMMAGTVVGIAALTVIMAAGKGTERKVMKRIEGFGPRAIMLIAGGGKDLPPPDMTVTTLKLEDAEAIRRELDGIETVSPMAWSFQMGVHREGKQYQAVVWGVEPNWHDAWSWYARTGEGIVSGDVATLARTCVIGETIRRELFGDADPIGEHVYINNVRLAVKGVLERRGASAMGGDSDNRVVLPITTAMRRVMNIDHVGAIRIIVKDPSRLHDRTEAIRAFLHERHHITPPEEDDFRLITPLVIAELARGTSRTLSLLLMALAALSLAVGGVVLMNILLISVSERKREIGLRRAVGATRRDILAQFLTESLAVTFAGMLAGCVLGVGVCLVLGRFTPMPVALSWEPVALGLAFALLVGTLFGVQPARKAARLNPVEALR
jgi:putative ABC transport system permease protein